MRCLGIFVLVSALGLQSCADLVARAIADPKGTSQAAAVSLGAGMASSLVGADSIQAVAQMEQTVSNLRRLAEEYPDALNAADIEALANHFDSLMVENANVAQNGVVIPEDGLVHEPNVVGDGNRRFGGFVIVDERPDRYTRDGIKTSEYQEPEERRRVWLGGRTLIPLSDDVILVTHPSEVKPYWNLGDARLVRSSSEIYSPRRHQDYVGRNVNGIGGNSTLGSTSLGLESVVEDVIADFQAAMPQPSQGTP